MAGVCVFLLTLAAAQICAALVVAGGALLMRALR